MSQKWRRDTPEWAWEQVLIDAYYDYRWHQVLDPLAAATKRWEAGELDHVDLARAAGRIHKQVPPIPALQARTRTSTLGQGEEANERRSPSPSVPGLPHPHLATEPFYSIPPPLALGLWSLRPHSPRRINL